MTAEHGCGDSSNVGEPKIVGIEDAFTGRGLDPLADPTGLGLLLAMIDGRYWPVHVCGDSGVGAPFSENPIGVNKGGNVQTEFEPFGDPVTAHGCLMKCIYNITVSLAAEVIVAQIDGQYQILRVRHTSFTNPVLGSSNDCRCCGMTPQRQMLYYRILSVSPPGCGSIRACDEYEINPGESCLPSTGNPLSIRVGCISDAGSAIEEADDWSVYVCGVPAAITELYCAAPIPDCIPEEVTPGSDVCQCPEQYYPDSYGTRLEIYVTATCGGCSYEILIYSKPEYSDPCALEDVPIRNVEVEACGLPNLQVGDRLIVAEIPTTEVDYYTGCPLVEYFLIRACTSDDCADPCDPPPLPTSCCGILCPDLPASLTALIEIMDCDCACTVSVPLTKMPCTPGSDAGEWRYEPSLPVIICENSQAKFVLTSIRLMCGEPSYEGASDGFSIVADGQDGTLVDSICEPGAFYFVFEFADLPLCLDKMPGRYPVDLSCTARITIVE